MISSKTIIIISMLLLPCSSIQPQFPPKITLDQNINIIIEKSPSDIAAYEYFFKFTAFTQGRLEGNLSLDLAGDIIQETLTITDSKGLIRSYKTNDNHIDIPLSIYMKNDDVFQITLKYRTHLTVFDETKKIYKLPISIIVHAPLDIPSNLMLNIKLPYGMTPKNEDKYIPIIYWRTNEKLKYKFVNKNPVELNFETESENGTFYLPSDIYYELFDKPGIIINKQQDIELPSLKFIQSDSIRNYYERSFQFKQTYDTTKIPIFVKVFDSKGTDISKNIIEEKEDYKKIYIKKEVKGGETFSINEEKTLDDTLIKSEHFSTVEKERKWLMPFDSYIFENEETVIGIFEKTSQIILYKLNFTTTQNFIIDSSSYLNAKPLGIKIQIPTEEYELVTRTYGLFHLKVEHQFSYSFEQIEFVNDDSIPYYDLNYKIYLKREPITSVITTLWALGILIPYFARKRIKSLQRESKKSIYGSFYLALLTLWIGIYYATNFPLELIFWHKGLWLLTICGIGILVSIFRR